MSHARSFAIAALALAALAIASVERAPPAVPSALPRAAVTVPAAAQPVPAGHAALVIDTALLALFNAYLLERDDPGRGDALLLHLRQSLAPQAYPEAAALVERYQHYMRAHDALLAAQGLSGDDMRRIAIWCDQRARLRQQMLGVQVAEQWFGQQDAQLRRIFEETARPFDLLSQTALDQAIQSFATLAREEPGWRRRHSAYLQAKLAIMQDAGLDEAARSVKVRELLLRAFGSEAERYRARSLEND